MDFSVLLTDLPTLVVVIIGVPAVLAAYIVLRHGLVYAPYVDRLEKELEAARRNDPTEHAKRVLETYTATGGRNAMRLSHSRFCSSDGPNP